MEIIEESRHDILFTTTGICATKYPVDTNIFIFDHGRHDRGRNPHRMCPTHHSSMYVGRSHDC